MNHIIETIRDINEDASERGTRKARRAARMISKFLKTELRTLESTCLRNKKDFEVEALDFATMACLDYLNALAPESVLSLEMLAINEEAERTWP